MSLFSVLAQACQDSVKGLVATYNFEQLSATELATIVLLSTEDLISFQLSAEFNRIAYVQKPSAQSGICVVFDGTDGRISENDDLFTWAVMALLEDYLTLDNLAPEDYRNELQILLGHHSDECENQCGTIRYSTCEHIKYTKVDFRKSESYHNFINMSSAIKCGNIFLLNLHFIAAPVEKYDLVEELKVFNGAITPDDIKAPTNDSEPSYCIGSKLHIHLQKEAFTQILITVIRHAHENFNRLLLKKNQNGSEPVDMTTHPLYRMLAEMPVERKIQSPLIMRICYLFDLFDSDPNVLETIQFLNASGTKSAAKK